MGGAGTTGPPAGDGPVWYPHRDMDGSKIKVFLQKQYFLKVSSKSALTV